VLEIFHRSLLNPDQEWLNFLETLAGQAAIAIESTSLFADLQQMNEELIKAYDSTIEGWSHALDLRDKETEGHTLRVTELTLELARAFGFGEAELVHVRRGALLHDIGKMGIPDRILLKEGPLTPDEWEIMRKHPVYAHEMLLPIEYLRQTLDIPYCHHEKWAGTGYPRGLSGEEIPLIARIFAVVDVWDAVTSDRPYRRAWSREKALAHIQEGAGTHFDPLVVEVFLGLIKQKQDIVDDPSGE
jgi:putative nucleotidyltransferase with HDIG domain